MKHLIALLICLSGLFAKGQNPATICAGASFTLTATNPQNLSNPSYSLLPGGTTNTTGIWIVTPQTTTSYTVFTTGQDQSNSTITTSNVVSVNVNAQPLTAVTVTQSNCTNSMSAFNLGLSFGAFVTPVYTILWSPIPQGILSSTQFSVNANLAAGAYNATITTAAGCSATANFTINPVVKPVVFSLHPSSGSYVVNCYNPTVTVQGSSSILTYTWNHASQPVQTGTTASFNGSSLGTWSVAVLDPVTGCSSNTTIVITQNTTTPNSALTPTFQNIVCGLNSITNVTATANPSVNVMHQFMSPLGGTMTAYSYSAIYLPMSPGTYTHAVINIINGCSTYKTFTVTSAQGFPSFSVVSAQNFSLGCGTKSVASISIVNAVSSLPGGPVSYTLLTPGFFGNVPASVTLSPFSVYTVSVPGTYTVLTRDNTSFCDAATAVSVLQNVANPDLNIVSTSTMITCDQPQITLEGSSSTPNVTFNWAFPPTGNVSSTSVQVVALPNSPTATLIGNYTLTITDNNNLCKSSYVIPVLQNIFPPKAVIAPPAPAISCASPSVVLMNQSQTTIPSALPHFLPVVAESWYGPAPSLPLQNTTIYTAATAGVYTMTAKDLNNGCTSTTVITVADNRVFPQVSLPSDFIFLPCPGTAVLSPVITGPPVGNTYSWSAPANASVSGTSSASLTTNSPGFYTLTVSNTYSCTSIVVFPVYACVGINESAANTVFSVFPNPGNGLFTVKAEGLQNATVEIYNGLGMLVKKDSLSSNEAVLDIQNEANGVYIIRIMGHHGQKYNLKVIKN